MLALRLLIRHGSRSSAQSVPCENATISAALQNYLPFASTVNAETSELTSLKRWFATQQHIGEGPPRSKIRAVPFTVTPYEAKDAFEAHHAGNWLYKQPAGGLQKQKEAYLPFWITSATLRSALHSAEVGNEEWTTVFNAATKRFEGQLRMHWQQVPFDVVFERQYSAEQEGSQVYAAWKYPRSSVKAVRPADSVRMAKPFTPDMVDAASDGTTRRVGPFEMRPAVAAGLSLDWYKKQEHAAAAKWIKDQLGCDGVRSVYLETTVLAQQTSPVYSPVFILRSDHMGYKIHTFVAGTDARRTSGLHVFDELRVGGLAGAAGLVGIMVTQAWKWTSLASLLGAWVVPPALLAAVAARFVPTATLQLSRAYQAQQREQAAQAQGPWDAEYVYAFDPDAQERRRERVFSGGYYDRTSRQEAPPNFEEFFRRIFGQEQSSRRQEDWQRQRQRQRQQRQQPPFGGPQQARPTGDPGDPAGHYKRLGVSPSASKDEIQAAFRGLAIKNHPDHVNDPKEKAAASARFRAILESYNVLRDPSKRAQYDRGQL